MQNQIKTEVVIIGAGLSGMLMAVALAENNINCVLLDRQDVDNIITKQTDARTSAISYGSSLIFKEYGVWDQVEKESAPILNIRVTDDLSPLFVHFDHREVSDNPMGYIVENHIMRKVFYQKIKQSNKITTIFNKSYTNIKNEGGENITSLDDGTKISAPLIIAADGKNSNIRKLNNIDVDIFDYKQSAIVCNVNHKDNHNNIALEKFLPSGPFAVLPMKGGYKSSLVWTESSKLANCYAQMPKDEFNYCLNEKFAGYLSDVSVDGEVFSYPLKLYNSKQYISKRVALIGDAAHSIHPIAGQGFNLSIRDISEISKLLSQAKDVGQDLGSADLLEQYSTIRKKDCLSMIMATDGLNRLFSNDIFFIKHLRRIGLKLVNNSKALKRGFIRQAMGI